MAGTGRGNDATDCGTGNDDALRHRHSWLSAHGLVMALQLAATPQRGADRTGTAMAAASGTETEKVRVLIFIKYSFQVF